MATKFSDLINSEVPTLVDFYAEWCGPCKQMKPILESVKNTVKDQARILKIDVDKNPQLAASFNIQGVPTLVLFKSGEVKWRQSGVVSSQQLNSTLAKFIVNA
ncbi:MAG: thioredoxin [Bacteroidetes bacterium]|nr:thioredoxin [Bacteroidota bacterium]MBK9671865.1 thioredoxin [Bacteroidota bacterium]MBK9798562.1 thioredoxin [Bacteroidota bacterium]MBP6413228.1 thioredoxin [Bacteroidia bacterium]